MPITPVLILHVGVGAACLISGFAALVFRKGSRPHRAAGRVFAVTTLAVSVSAVYLALFAPEKMISVIGGTLAFYLVVTGWLAVARQTKGSVLVDLGLLVLPLVAGAGALALGLEAAGSESGTKEGLAPGAYYFWAGTAAICVALDLKVILCGGVSGVARISRHLWRMCFALFIAEAAVLLGQQQVFPELLRHPYVISAPLLVVIFLMVFWLVRIRYTKPGANLGNLKKWQP